MFLLWVRHMHRPRYGLHREGISRREGTQDGVLDRGGGIDVFLRAARCRIYQLKSDFATFLCSLSHSNRIAGHNTTARRD